MLLLLNPRRTRTNMKLLQLVWIFLLTLCGQSAVIEIQVKEDDDVILDCSFGSTNIENKAFDWKKTENKKTTDVLFYSEGKPKPGPEFKSRVFHFPDQLRFGNASIKITKAKTSDSGTYTCYHATVQKEIKSTINLTVGAATEPYVSNLHQTQTSALLRCIVRGAFPKPEVVWMNSDGKILDADEPKVTKTEGNKYDIILNVTVTKTDRYRCVATQTEINSQINGTTFVHFNGGASKPHAKEINETKDGVLLQCVVQDPSPELKVSWKNKAGQDIPSKEQKTENSIILWTTVTKTDDYRCVTTEGKKDDEVYDEIRVKVLGEPSNNSISGVAVGSVIAVVAIVAAIVVVLYLRKRDKRHLRGPSQEQNDHSEGVPFNSATGPSEQPR